MGVEDAGLGLSESRDAEQGWREGAGARGAMARHGPMCTLYESPSAPGPIGPLE